MTFWRIVSQGSMVGFWNAMPTPTRSAPTCRPATKTSPSVGRSRPVTSFRIVDLPQPEGPTMATKSPACTVRSVQSSARKASLPAPKRTFTSSSWTMRRTVVVGSRRPSRQSASATQFRMAWVDGSNSRPRFWGSRPARTRSTICCRNSGAWGGRVLGIAEHLVRKHHRCPSKRANLNPSRTSWPDMDGSRGFRPIDPPSLVRVST